MSSRKSLVIFYFTLFFTGNIASETQTFEIGDVIYTLMDKLIRRHPHVFGEQSVSDEEQVAENWENIKLKKEKKIYLRWTSSSPPLL